MRIGIVPTLEASAGGLYQYNLTLLRTLHDLDHQGSYIVFTDAPSALPGELSTERVDWIIKSLSPPPAVPPAKSFSQRALDGLRRGVGEGPHRELWRVVRKTLHGADQQGESAETIIDPDTVWWQPAMGDWFRACGAEAMLYPNPLALSFESRVPYAMSIHDLQHRLQPEWPEVSADQEWEAREYLFRNAARHAELLIADSEVGKEDILEFYGPFGITADRVKVLPFLPSAYLSIEISKEKREQVRQTYQLADRYLFYPAQFWPHKNHARIVRALDLLKREYQLEIPIVFCGSHGGKIREETFFEVKQLAAKFGLEQQILFLGYVPDEDISALYAEARALVMPTFFGPTNIPILEAWAFGCPVLTSDIRGVREQVGDAGILVDPRSVESIAEGIYRISTDDDLHFDLGNRGRQRLKIYTPHDYQQRLIEILAEMKERLS